MTCRETGATFPVLTQPDNGLCVLTLRDLLTRCERTSNQHRQNAKRWQRHAAVHKGPGGHVESLEKCLAKAERESRLSRVWQAYAEALREVLKGNEHGRRRTPSVDVEPQTVGRQSSDEISPGFSFTPRSAPPTSG